MDFKALSVTLGLTLLLAAPLAAQHADTSDPAGQALPEATEQPADATQVESPPVAPLEVESDATSSSDTGEELPRTASPITLLALLGLGGVGGAIGLLRLRRRTAV